MDMCDGDMAYNCDGLCFTYTCTQNFHALIAVHVLVFLSAGEQDIPKLHKELIPIQSNWRCFATQLGLLDYQIRSIAEVISDPCECLRRVLNECVKNLSLSWRSVCEATACPAGGDNRKLADNLAKYSRHVTSNGEQGDS